GDNSDMNLPSAWTYAGGGTSTLFVRGGDASANNAESYLNFAADATIGNNMKLIVGDASDDTSGNTDHEGRVNDTSGTGTKTLLVTGTGVLELRNAGVAMNVTINSGGTVTATGRNG